jgi:uncharacterized protein (DUF433 family)
MRVEISKHIVADTEICHGKPTFNGTRVLVSDILELLATDEPIERILKSYPGLTKEMVQEALEWAAKVISGEHHVKYTKVPA